MGRATRRLRQLKSHIIHGRCVASRLGDRPHYKARIERSYTDLEAGTTEDVVEVSSDCGDCEYGRGDEAWTLILRSRRGWRWWKKRCKRRERDPWGERRARDVGIAASYMADREYIPF